MLLKDKNFFSKILYQSDLPLTVRYNISLQPFSSLQIFTIYIEYLASLICHTDYIDAHILLSLDRTFVPNITDSVLYN